MFFMFYLGFFLFLVCGAAAVVHIVQTLSGTGRSVGCAAVVFFSCFLCYSAVIHRVMHKIYLLSTILWTILSGCTRLSALQGRHFCPIHDMADIYKYPARYHIEQGIIMINWNVSDDWIQQTCARISIQFSFDFVCHTFPRAFRFAAHAMHHTAKFAHLQIHTVVLLSVSLYRL